MAEPDAITFGDLIDRLEALRVTCFKCGLEARFMVRRLAAQRGLNAPLTDFLAEVTAVARCGTASIGRTSARRKCRMYRR